MALPPSVLAIVGGGFAGTTMAVQARAAWPASRILLFEPAAPGPGLAYSTPDPNHLLNVPATGMSLYPDRPTHFAEWLAMQADAPAAGEGPCFAPRRMYGRYLREQVSSAAAQGGLQHVPQRIVALLPRPEGGFRLQSEDGAEHAADQVVLALGGFAAEGGTPPHVFGDPWDPAALQGLDPKAPVLLVGLGLTMVDVLLTLRGRGHRGPVLGISRHGWLPLSHVAGAFPPPWPMPSGEALWSGPLAALCTLRRAAAEAATAGQPWQAVIDGLRPQVQRIWQEWDLSARRRFLRHGRSIWNLHRHRVAPGIAGFLAEQRASGALEIMAGRLAAWRPTKEGVEVSLRLQKGVGLTRHVARALLCTGPDASDAWRSTPPIPPLVAADLAAPDPLRLGLSVRADGQMLAASGQPVPGLWALGPLTRGSLWEITAVPEIRAQAAALIRAQAEGPGTAG
ncbi:FAD/NAD(P)-binding protein [Roseomonas sp. E05]|uniref:FAD/NAD(P)-binding protein n=1 Tax=Roseomonas sp. E05 TaxID=3046310 RepID=UPI0024BA40CE|nr:FAD/NAD(P)-binding protein [Roseomonas sp. E05]MDJ0391472.1 FAD/NAD(P)-binding protein [Roseomonas sp. E05]